MTPTTDVRGHRHRPDIQGLRAIAVLLVMVTHAFPQTLTGGFLGVDVFFVISGYLITGLLAEEYRSTGRIDLARFYARRAGRLLPLAVTVLVVTGLVVFLVLSPFLRETAGRHLVASGLYVQNWMLIADSASYAAVDEGASPFQHYWSLSVEEQFYIVLPVCLLLGLRSGRRTGFAVLTILTAASLGFALGWTPDNDAAAYFNTATRVWEFGFGGLAALLGLRLTRGRLAAQLGAVVALGAVVGLVDDATHTPGPTTLIAVLATLVLLLPDSEDAPRSTPVDAVLSSRPFTLIGDMSYGLYLWHWPALVVAQGLLAGSSGTAIALAASFGLAAASLPLERSFRQRVSTAARTTRRSVLAGGSVVAAASALAVVVGTGLAGTAPQTTAQPPSNQPSPPVREGEPLESEECVGAAAMAPGADCPTGDSVQPDPASARTDMPHEECKESLTGQEVRDCTFGEGDVRVALVGDSHAQRLLPALEPVAAKRGWSVTSYLKSSCPFSAARPIAYSSSCSAWNDAVMERLLREKYDIVLVSSASGVGFHPDEAGDSFSAGAAGMVDHWTRLHEEGAHVIAVRDNPQPGFARIDPPACVLRNGPSQCDASQDQALKEDPQVRAVEESNGAARLIDLTRYYCRDGQCPSVIGGVLVYRDGQHIHSAFARTLAPYLDQELEAFDL